MECPCSGETEAEEEQAPRRLLLGRSQRPQGSSRRLLGTAPARPARVLGTPSVPRTRSRRENSQLVSHQSVIHQDLLAPMSPGHESDEEAAPEAEAEESYSPRAAAVEQPGARPVRRRLGIGTNPRLQTPKGAAGLRDVREDFAEATAYQEEVKVQGIHKAHESKSNSSRNSFVHARNPQTLC